MKWSEMTPFERDQLVADKVLGYDLGHFPDDSYQMWKSPDILEPMPIPNYSSNMGDAWQVVDAMRSYHRPLLPQATRADLTIADIFLVQLWELTGRRGIDALLDRKSVV